MHELSLCSSIAEIIGRRAGDRRVETIRMRIGELRQVVPDTLTYCWGLVSETTPLAGSVLDIERVPARVHCDACETEHDLGEYLDFTCPVCQAVATRVVAGEEFLITSMDVAVGEVAR